MHDSYEVNEGRGPHTLRGTTSKGINDYRIYSVSGRRDLIVMSHTRKNLIWYWFFFPKSKRREKILKGNGLKAKGMTKDGRVGGRDTKTGRIVKRRMGNKQGPRSHSAGSDHCEAHHRYFLDLFHLLFM